MFEASLPKINLRTSIMYLHNLTKLRWFALRRLLLQNQQRFLHFINVSHLISQRTG